MSRNMYTALCQEICIRHCDLVPGVNKEGERGNNESIRKKGVKAALIVWPCDVCGYMRMPL